jgi:acyl-CoA thioester hydrolase
LEEVSQLSHATNTAETTFHVRYAETDQMGIVHHTAYTVWMEEGRSNWLRANGTSFTEFEKEGLSLAVSELHVRYSQPARYDQLVTVRCWIEEVRSRKVTFGYEIVEPSSGDLFARGYSKHICIDRQANVVRIPDKWRRFLSL